MVEFGVFQGLQAPSFEETSRPIRVFLILRGGLERRHSALRRGPRIEKPDLLGSPGLHPVKEIK